MGVGNEGSAQLPSGKSGPIDTSAPAPVGNPGSAQLGSQGSGPIKK